MEVVSEKINFTGSQGYKISARLDRPQKETRFYAIYAPCFTCTKDVHAAVRICGALAERGIAVLRLDFTGIGASEGDFSQTNFSSNVADLLAAIDYMKKNYSTPHLLIGHSLGGTASLVATHRSSDIEAVVTINSPCQPRHVGRHFKGAESELELRGEVDVSIAGRQFTIQKHFFEDLQTYDMDEILPQLKAALLVLHAPNDDMVNIKNAGYIFSTAVHPKSFISLDRMDHMIAKREDAEYVASLIDAWVSPYIEKNQNVPSEHLSEVIVTETGRSTYAQDIRVRDHQLIADEPTTFEGGKDLGPSPYDYLLTALGACTSMTLRMYANLKNLPLKKVTVRLRHDKGHAEDCEDCQTKTGMIDFIKRDIVLEGDLTSEQKEALLRIADKCPVHKTLTHEIKIRTKLKNNL